MKKLMNFSALLSLAAFLMMPVMAGATDETRMTRVSNRSSATVRTASLSIANSGFNYAAGSYAGDAGNGGDVESEGDESEVEGVGTGNGGDGGTASDGAVVQTGDAVTSTSVMNRVNTNRTVVNDTADDEDDVLEYNELRIYNTNRANVENRVASLSNTGANYADGSYGGNGGDGGEVESDGDDDESEVEGIGTGDGGDGGDSGLGGTVVTSNARTTTDVVNVVNRNITRVVR